MANTKRYCIEKLIHIHYETGAETWRRTKWCDDQTHMLETMFLTEGHRIVDTHEQREIRRNVPRGFRI